MSIPALTKKQWLLVGYMRRYLAEFDRLPTQQQISEYFEWSSPNAANEMLRALVKKGVLEAIDGGKVRFARLVLTADELVDAAREHEILAAGQRCEAAKELGDAAETAHYAGLQKRLIASRSAGQVLRMELERGIAA